MDLSGISTEELKGMLESPKEFDISKIPTSKLRSMAGLNPLTDDQLSKVKELNESMGVSSDGGLAGKIANNSIVRGTVSGMQKMLDASYNPVGQIAKGLNYSFGNGKWELPESLKPDIEPQNATERAISNVLDYGQDALTFLAGAQALKGAGVLGKGASTASKIARGLAAGTEAEALAGSTGAGTLTGIVNPETWYGNLATGVVGGMLGGGILSGAKAAKNAWNVRQGGKELQKQLSRGDSFTDINYGKISNKKLSEINRIRAENGLTPITKADVSIPADRVEHLYQGRIVGDKYTPKDVNGVLKSTVHNKKSTIEGGKYKTLQEANLYGKNTTNKAVVGANRNSNGVYVKTAYKTDPVKIEGGAKAPPKLTATGEPFDTAAYLENSIAQKTSNVKENNFINALSDTNKVRRLKNAVQAGEKGIQEQADDLLNRMVARQNGAYDEALEQSLKTPKMIKAENNYKVFMDKNGSARISKQATRDFYRENPIASGLIEEARNVDPQIFKGVARGSLKEFDMAKRMLRMMAGNQAEKTVKQSAAENAEKAIKKLMDDSFKGFREVNKDYAAARLGQELFEKKVFNNVRNLSKASTSPFWSVLASSAAGAGTFGALAHNPASLALGLGALGGKAAVRGLRRQAGRAIMEGKTPIYDATISGIKNSLSSTGKGALKYGTYPSLSVLLNELNRKGE